MLLLKYLICHKVVQALEKVEDCHRKICLASTVDDAKLPTLAFVVSNLSVVWYEVERSRAEAVGMGDSPSLAGDYRALRKPAMELVLPITRIFVVSILMKKTQI